MPTPLEQTRRPKSASFFTIGSSHSRGEVRIICRLRRMRSEIGHFMAVRFELLQETLFEDVPRMIGAYGYLHGLLFNPNMLPCFISLYDPQLALHP